MNFSFFLSQISMKIWSLPFLLWFFGVCVYMTVKLGFVQFRYFTESIKLVFKPRLKSDLIASSENLSPFQAFINTLGGNIGNGSLSGVPVAIAIGGPGSIFWMMVMSTFAVALRFSEVYLATYYGSKSTTQRSGPMYYLSLLPGGQFLSFSFAFFCLAFMLSGGNIIQCNAVGLSLYRTWGIDFYTTGLIILVFISYVIFGGAQRIVAALDKLVPFKVISFLISAIIVLLYNYRLIFYALGLMVSGAFQPEAFLGGTFLFALQQSLAIGFSNGVNASEAGLGTAAVAFGTTKNQNAVQSGIMSMLSVYINTHIVCFLVALCVLSSGAWNNGETSILMLISSFETVFGVFAGWIVSLLVVLFAISVLVAYAFNARICWSFLFGQKHPWIFSIMYIALAFYGTVMSAQVVWTINSLTTAGLFVTNVVGLLYFANNIKVDLKAYQK